MKKILLIGLLSSILIGCGSGNSTPTSQPTTSFQVIGKHNESLMYGTLNGLSGNGYNGTTKITMQLYNDNKLCADGNFTIANKKYSYKIQDCVTTVINSQKVIIAMLDINNAYTEVIMILDDSLYPMLNNIKEN